MGKALQSPHEQHHAGLHGSHSSVDFNRNMEGLYFCSSLNKLEYLCYRLSRKCYYYFLPA